MHANTNVERAKIWYESSYAERGFEAQRYYPNEELLRFLGREFFTKVPKAKRRDIKILELGCGTCANLWAVAKEGFDAYGIDISSKAIERGQQMLNHWGVRADVLVGNMTDMPYNDSVFDVILDVVSAYCFTDREFQDCLDEAARCLKPRGKFFSYAPCVNSDAFKDFFPATKLDAWTLDGIHRETSPYFGNHYAIHFVSPERYEELLLQRSFKVIYLETVSRTYRQREEVFEFVTVVAQKM